MSIIHELDIRHPRQEKLIKALENKNTSVDFSDPLENEMIINMGPQHPATHGVLRLLVRLDGETVDSLIPEVGYLHRGYEKLAENCSLHEFIPHTDRLDYISPLANNTAYVLAVEKLLGIESPRRAQFIRVLLSELARISSHLLAVGATALDIGALTVFVWTFREREKLYDIFEKIVGARFTTSFTRIGGVSHDITNESLLEIKKFTDEFPESLNECANLLHSNRIFIERMENVGVISKEKSIALGLTGPNLRGSGVEYDVRRAMPYLVYNELDFKIPTFNEGDALARYYVRYYEMVESLKIIKQVIDKIPAGDILANDPKKVLPRKEKIYTKMEELIHDFMLINFGTNPPVGEVYSAIEGSKGELGFYIQSRGEGNPWRLKIHSPSFMSVQSIPFMTEGYLISDIVAIIGSLDPVMGEVDK